MTKLVSFLEIIKIKPYLCKMLIADISFHIDIKLLRAHVFFFLNLTFEILLVA